MKLWIARNRDGFLGLYDDFPDMHAGYFVSQLGKDVLELNSELFPELTFENSPQEVELKLVNEIVGVAESPSKTFPRVNEFEVGASYRR